MLTTYTLDTLLVKFEVGAKPRARDPGLYPRRMPSVLSPLRPLRRARPISSAAQCGPSNESSAGVGRFTAARFGTAAACLGPVYARANGLLWHAWVSGHSVVKPSPKPGHSVVKPSIGLTRRCQAFNLGGVCVSFALVFGRGFCRVA